MCGGMARTRSIPAAVLLMCVAVASADFERDDVSGSYERVAGGSECPGTIRLSRDERQIEASHVRVDDKKCAGGSISISENPDGNALTKALLREDDAGDIMGGQAKSVLVCGQKSVAQGSYFNFIEPDDDFTLVWSTVFGVATTGLQVNGGPSFEFEEDSEYLVQDDSCLFRKGRRGVQTTQQPVPLVTQGAQPGLDAAGSPEAEGDSSDACFPGSATVQLESGESVRMDKLTIGNRVLVGDGKFSDVFAWTHNDADYTSTDYVRLTTASGLTLTTSAGHYVYANGRAVPARTVRAGNTMTHADGTPSAVTSVRRVADRGLFNPQTIHGDIVVNGVLSTTYTTAIEPRAAHAMLAPVRAAYTALQTLSSEAGCTT